MKTVCSPQCVNLILYNTIGVEVWLDRTFNFCIFCMGHEEGYQEACHELLDLWRAANV